MNQMKKLLLIAFLLTGIFFQYCSSSKKAHKTSTPAITYTNHVQSIIATSCSPCHIPPGGNKKALNSYTAAKDNIDDIISRIEKNPTDRGFMPFKHPKLPDSTIQVFVQWKNAGMPE
jgi:nitrate/TMAO reductase-like tetraheme cytochrome c subunit